jgi:hypothetical protein
LLDSPLISQSRSYSINFTKMKFVGTVGIPDEGERIRTRDIQVFDPTPFVLG